MTTTRGLSAITSCRNRTSICGVVWPVTPRFTYGLPGEELRASLAPELGDLVAEKHDALFAWRRRRQLAVVAAVASQPGPVAEQVPIRRQFLFELQRPTADRPAAAPPPEAARPRSAEERDRADAFSCQRHACMARGRESQTLSSVPAAFGTLKRLRPIRPLP